MDKNQTGGSGAATQERPATGVRRVTLKAGTTLTLNGIPLNLPMDTNVETNAENIAALGDAVIGTRDI